MTETHWRKLTNPNYIGAYDFTTGEKRIVKITKVVQEKVFSPDGKATDCIVAHLENSKPLVMCKTNCKTIAKLLETPIIEKWSGKSIQLEVKKVKAFGEWVEALRVSDTLPTKEELNPSHPKWNSAIEALKNKTTTIKAIESKYTLIEENKQLLCNSSK